MGFVTRSSKLAVALAKQLLALHQPDDGAKNEALVASLSRKFHSHSYPVSRREADDIGLPINKDRDPTLEALMWEAWLDLEAELQERKPFGPILEVFSNAAAAAELLKPVPQLDLPPNASGPNNFQADLALVNAEVHPVPPVDFQQLIALMESPRLATRSVKRGKILACRLPDLNIQFNSIVSFRGWEKSHP